MSRVVILTLPAMVSRIVILTLSAMVSRVVILTLPAMVYTCISSVRVSFHENSCEISILLPCVCMYAHVCCLVCMLFSMYACNNKMRSMSMYL